MKLKIPFYSQKTSFSCGPASLQMIFSYFKKPTTQKSLMRKAHTTHEGTIHQNIINVALKEKFYCYVNNNSTIHEIKHFVDSGYPVIINYTEPSSEEGHYSIVRGYDKKGIVMNDPWNGKDFRLTEKEFLSRWHDHHKHHQYKKWMMVISKTDLQLGKQYLPH